MTNVVHIVDFKNKRSPANKRESVRIYPIHHADDFPKAEYLVKKTFVTSAHNELCRAKEEAPCRSASSPPPKDQVNDVINPPAFFIGFLAGFSLDVIFIILGLAWIGFLFM